MSYAAGIFLLAFLQAAQPASERFGPGAAFRLESSRDSFGVRSHGVEEITGGGVKIWPLPQSDFATYAKLRPKDAELNPLSATAGNYDREEAIGPHQVEGDRLWFGKSFYDAEGMRGVGAFGYFDARTRQYKLFSPPEVAPWEVSAILVEPDRVWLGLDHFGEDISTFPGGLAEWDRTTQTIHRFPVEFVITAITREGDSLRLTTAGGYALLANGSIRRFLVRANAKGGTETTPVAAFPPPPTHH